LNHIFAKQNDSHLGACLVFVQTTISPKLTLQTLGFKSAWRIKRALQIKNKMNDRSGNMSQSEHKVL
jgi:hypothetical protein